MRVMKSKLAIFMFIITTTFANAADKPTDITGADATTFKAHVGHVISICGRLEEGKPGPCLHGATPSDVVFYVIHDMPPSGSYSYPKTWTQLRHKQVRLTGELKFRSFDRSKSGPLYQVPPDYYYLVLQRTSIERIESR
jgi:hypothetical protein